MGTFSQQFRKRMQHIERPADPDGLIFAILALALGAVLGGILPIALLGDGGLGKGLACSGGAFGFVLGLLIYGTLGALVDALMDSIHEGFRSRFGRVGESVFPASLGALIGGIVGHSLGSLRELDSPTMGAVVGGLAGSLVLLVTALVRR